MPFQTKKHKNLSKFECPKGFRHLAIIMDGNGRWATNKGWPRYFGHFKGVKALYKTIQHCCDLNIPYLTVFAFSTENWKRPSKEVSLIMKLMERTLIRRRQDFKKYQVRLHFLGDLQELDPSVQNIFIQMMEQTKNHKRLNLIVAVNYGGRQEIATTARALAKKAIAGEIRAEDINEESFRTYMPSSAYPPPDMIIRTGAVSRLSNFYLWGGAYSELYVSQMLWPDFNLEELKKALTVYAQTSRRFGTVDHK